MRIVDLLFVLAVLRIVASGVATLPWRRPPSLDTPYQAQLATFGALLLGAGFLHALLIAATHTFDIWRYVTTLQPLVFAVIACGGLMMLADVARLLRGMSGARPTGPS